jgi:oxygen-independent coproporphyrinogen-3 oxidase
LVRAGYQAIGLDHFALPRDAMAIAAREGRLRRNFQGYTTDSADTMIGLGATSIGRTPSGYYQNIAETGAWARAVADGTPPVAKGLALTDDDRLRGRVIERIMCDGAVDPVAMGAEHGRAADWCADEMMALGEMETDGLVIRDGDRIVLTSAGLALSRVVASVFDAWLARSEARHSVAV